MAIGTFAKLLAQGVKSRLLSPQNKKIFDSLDKLKPGEVLNKRGLMKENNLSDGSRGTLKNILNQFYPNPKFIVNPTKKQIKDIKTTEMIKVSETKRAAEKIIVPKPRRNTKGDVTRVDYPNKQMEKDFIKDFNAMMDVPKSNSANAVLAKKYFGEATPYNIAQIERMNNFYRGTTGKVKVKADPNQANINRQARVAEGKKFINEDGQLTKMVSLITLTISWKHNNTLVLKGVAWQHL